MERCKDVIYFANNATNSLYEFYHGGNIDDASEKERIIKLVSNLVKPDIN